MFSCGVLPGSKHINSIVCASNRPVVVLSGNHWRLQNGFSCRRTFHSMLTCDPLLMSASQSGCDPPQYWLLYKLKLPVHMLKAGATSLCWVLDETPHFQRSMFHISHKSGNSLTDRSKIMIVQLLSFWWHSLQTVWPVYIKSFLWRNFLHLPRKYSCSVPTDGVTFFEVVFPNKRRSLSACTFNACMERSSGVFWSSASPV